MKAAEFLKNWDESNHIRDDGGRFGSGVGTLTRDVGAEFLSSRAQDKSSAAERARSGGSHVDDQIESHLGAAIAHMRAAEAHRDAANNEEAKMHQDKATEHVTEANLLRIDKVTAKSVRPDEPESEKIQKAKEWLEVVKTDISRVDTVFVKDWDESKHPRGAGGKFGSGESSSSESTKVVNGHEIKPNADLRGANLSLEDLNFADLRGANLSGAYLGGSELGYAYLMGADLTNASMSGADLRNADLTGADLRGADLYDADLRSANLSDAKLSGADLTDADLTGARGLPEGFGKTLAVKGGPGSKPHSTLSKDWDESKHPRGAGGRFGSGEAGNATGANYEHHVSEAMGASKEAQDALASLHKATDKGNTIIRQRVSALDSAHRTAASHFDKIGEKQLAYEHMRVGEMAARLRTNLSSANRQRALDGVLNASSSALDATNRWADS